MKVDVILSVAFADLTDDFCLPADFGVDGSAFF